VYGRIIASAGRVTPRTRMKVFEIVVRDDAGALNVIFFNQPYLRKVFKDGQQVVLFGRAERDKYSYTHRFQFRNPEFEIIEDDSDARIHTGNIVPIYRKLGPLTGKQLRIIIYHIFKNIDDLPETLPDEILKKHGFMSRNDSIRQVHFPVVDHSPGLERDRALEDLISRKSPAHIRMIFEEFFILQAGLQTMAQGRKQIQKGFGIEITDHIRDVVRRTLPFKPTGAQKRVIQEIVTDMTSAWPMNRLLQGDVGSGKTIVAVQAVIVAVENGCQAAIMAPTEILAEQHYRNFSILLKHAGYEMALLKSAMSATEKKRVKKGIAQGLIQIVVGTHSIIQKEVKFNKLSLVIIDEQHRFGVMQRSALSKKGQMPDILVMTATPIPRTLALTVYGDLALSIIDEMPPGRRPVKTKLLFGERDVQRGYELIRQEVEKGNQIYVVYPLIEESEKIDLRNAVQGYEELSSQIFPDFQVGLLHGRMSEDEKQSVMGRFLSGSLNILVSTTVIEVGIDVPRATVMLIQHAERFGLSQLHQLRGRIGRGTSDSWCIMVVYDVKTEDAKRRLEIMCRTSDGFRIAEEDLAIRGPGEFSGTRQSGILNFRFGSLIQHREIMEDARNEAESFIRQALSDPSGREMKYVEWMKQYWDKRFGLILVG